MPEVADLSERPRGQWWQFDEEMVDVPIAAVERLFLTALQQAGATEQDARFLLNVSLDKAIQGDNARGLELLPGRVRAALSGKLNLRASTHVIRETPGTALIEGDVDASGALVCKSAMELAIAKARDCGVGWVNVRNFPAGILTPHLMQAIEAGMVGMVMTQSYPMVAATGGYKPLLGNAPIGFGVPAGDRDPIILDLALTETSASGVKLAATQGQSVSPGFLLDENGNPTTDASAFPALGHLSHATQLSRGTLVPLGGSHKAYALILMVTLLTSVLCDASAPWESQEIIEGRPGDGRTRFGSLHVAVDPAAFLPIEEFRRQVDVFLDAIKATPRREGVEDVFYPGEVSQRIKRERKAAGHFLIPITHYDGLQSLASELSLDLIPRLN